MFHRTSQHPESRADWLLYADCGSSLARCCSEWRTKGFPSISPCSSTSGPQSIALRGRRKAVSGDHQGAARKFPLRLRMCPCFRARSFLLLQLHVFLLCLSMPYAHARTETCTHRSTVYVDIPRVVIYRMRETCGLDPTRVAWLVTRTRTFTHTYEFTNIHTRTEILSRETPGARFCGLGHR